MSLDVSPDVSTPSTDRHRALRRRAGAPRAYVAPVAAANPYSDSKPLSRQRTALALGALRSAGWSITHDVPAQRAVIEHMALGPAGSFVVESHTVGGSVRIDGDQVSTTMPGMATRTFPSDAWAHDARLHAAEANKLFSTQLSQRVIVNALVVIWGDFPQRHVEGHNVTFIHGDDLVGWLKARPARCGAGRIAELDAALASATRKAS